MIILKIVYHHLMNFQIHVIAFATLMEKIDISIIEKAIALARNAPSVCNRQSVEVILVNNKDVAQSILTIQSGMNATAENVNQILIITSEIGSFISPVERNQMFIDGGIFAKFIICIAF